MDESSSKIGGMNSDQDLILLETASVGDAVRVIEKNSIQTAFVIRSDEYLLGIVTNGDVRRFLLANGRMDSPVTEVLNQDFRSVTVTATREDVLRLFDLGFSVIPRLDDSGCLIDFVTPHHYQKTERSGHVIVRARAPARISFAGGGTDLTYFFSRLKGLVLNAAIARYAVTTLIPRKTSEIDIYSSDLGSHEFFPSLSAMLKAETHTLLSATTALLRPDFGFEMHVSSEFPVGSGLGGSSAVTTSVVSAFNELRSDRWSLYEIAELAFQAERLCFKVPGGWQDQYASAFGGFNLIEFMPSGTNVNPLRVPDDIVFELEESLLLFDTCLPHNSGDLHKVQKSEMANARGDEILAQLSDSCSKMHRALSREDLLAFGDELHNAWMLKKKTSTMISSDSIDRIYEVARKAGAIGGKLLGAGAGGHMLFFAPPGERASVIAAAAQLGCKAMTLRFDLKGTHSWRTKMR